MECPNCKAENPTAALYCFKCGARLDPTERVKEYFIDRKEREPKPTILQTFFSFNGRIGRATYWGASLILLSIEMFCIAILSNLPDQNLSFFLLFVLAVFVIWSLLALTVKRWHDLNKSAWWLLTMLIPLWSFISALELAFIKGDDGSNTYGNKAQSRPEFLVFGGLMIIILGGITVMVIGMTFVSPVTTSSPSIPPTAKVARVQPAAVSTRPPTATPNPCFLWSQITPQMSGTTVCVYGTVTDHVENWDAAQTFLYFGGRDKFFFTSLSRWEKIENACVSVTGKVELNTYKTPYIKFDKLSTCQ